MASHYTGITLETRTILELIDPELVEHFAAANVLKYTYRAAYRGEWRTDLTKARDYVFNWLGAEFPSRVQLITMKQTVTSFDGTPPYHALVSEAAKAIKAKDYNKLGIVVMVAEEILEQQEF